MKNNNFLYYISLLDLESLTDPKESQEQSLKKYSVYEKM
jgi:hypothetical protein